MKPTLALILTHVDLETGVVKLPHLSWLEFTNPDVKIEIVVIPETGEPQVDIWKNGDRFLREWWKLNQDRLQDETIAVMEWDCLVGKELPVLPPTLDLASASVMVCPIHLRNGWCPEKWKLSCFDGMSLGMLNGFDTSFMRAFGFFLCRRSVLDDICDARWNWAYEKSVLSETRLPSIAVAENRRLGEIALPFVKNRLTIVTPEAGIYHSVKQPFTGCFFS